MEQSGPRIRLREWRAGEIDAMHRWLGDPRVGRFLDWAPKDLAGSREHLRLCVGVQADPDRRIFYFAIERSSDGVVLGDVGFERTDESSQGSEVSFGYFLAPAFWGHGYATEAALLVLDLAFSSLGAARARAACDERNTASERVLLKCGLTRRPAEELPGRREYRTTREEWVTATRRFSQLPDPQN